MKKTQPIFFLPLFFAIALGACKKSSSDNSTTTTGTVVGFWGGTGTASGTTQVVSIVFKSDGKMRLYGGTNATVPADTAAIAAVNKSDGTYTVSGTSITCTYSTSGVLLLLAATANSGFTTMTGTAGISPATSGIGTFTFTKQ